MEGITVFFKVVVLATVVEALLEYVFGIWWTPFPEAARPKVLMAVGLVLGVALCICYGVDLMAELGLPPSVIGRAITGALVGRGADYVHAFWKKLKG